MIWTTQSNSCYAFAIERKTGTSGNASLRVHIPNWDRPIYFDNARSLSNLADAPAAVTIAALDVQTAGYPQESYSSEGPRMGPGGAIAGGAIGMDLSAYANVDTEAYGPNTFNGTSSATPHVAGAFALAKQANPGFTLAQLETFLNGRAQDKGVAGQDPLYGFGRLRLGAPPAPPSAQQPDGWIRVGAGADVGNGIYNLTAVGQSKSKKSAAGSTITFNITVQNDGLASDTFDLQGGSNATGYTGQVLRRGDGHHRQRRRRDVHHPERGAGRLLPHQRDGQGEGHCGRRLEGRARRDHHVQRRLAQEGRGQVHRQALLRSERSPCARGRRATPAAETGRGPCREIRSPLLFVRHGGMPATAVSTTA